MEHPVTSSPELSSPEIPSPGSTPRTTIRRISERAVTNGVVLQQVLDAGLIAHISVTDDHGQPYVLPIAYARMGNEVVFHGSTGSRLFRGLASGQPTCLTVTHLDGLVVARSAFESSMNYRSAMVLGVARRLDGQEAWDALKAITEHLTPGRWDSCRQPTRKEVASTMVLALSLNEASVKIRTGGPEDLPEDLEALPDLWAGEVPIVEQFLTPMTDGTCEPHTQIPDYVLAWRR